MGAAPPFRAKPPVSFRAGEMVPIHRGDFELLDVRIFLLGRIVKAFLRLCQQVFTSRMQIN